MPRIYEPALDVFLLRMDDADRGDTVLKLAAAAFGRCLSSDPDQSLGWAWRPGEAGAEAPLYVKSRARLPEGAVMSTAEYRQWRKEQ